MRKNSNTIIQCKAMHIPPCSRDFHHLHSIYALQAIHKHLCSFSKMLSLVDTCYQSYRHTGGNSPYQDHVYCPPQGLPYILLRVPSHIDGCLDVAECIERYHFYGNADVQSQLDMVFRDKNVWQETQKACQEVAHPKSRRRFIPTIIDGFWSLMVELHDEFCPSFEGTVLEVLLDKGQSLRRKIPTVTKAVNDLVHLFCRTSNIISCVSKSCFVGFSELCQYAFSFKSMWSLLTLHNSPGVILPVP